MSRATRRFLRRVAGRGTLLLGAVWAALLLIPGEASAIPAFNRQAGQNCMASVAHALSRQNVTDVAAYVQAMPGL